MKVRASVRAGGIPSNHARPLKVRTKVKAGGLPITNHARRLLTPSVKAMVNRESDELATAALAQLLPSRDYNALPVAILNSQGAEVARQDFAPLPDCGNRTKSGDCCNACHYCRVNSDGPEYWAR